MDRAFVGAALALAERTRRDAPAATGPGALMKALVTGIGGFAGRYLLRHLRAQGDEVLGMARAGDASDLPDQLPLFRANLLDRDAVDDAVRSARPDVVYHLAALSSTLDSLADPWATVGNNLQAQMNLLESLVREAPAARVLVISSSEVYGRVDAQQLPTGEDAPIRPFTPYALSKVGQDAMGYMYFAQHGLPVVRVRPFSHTGPGQDARFAIPNFARQVAEIEAGLRGPVVRVGNLDVERDFTDVRDMVRAYRLAATLGQPGDVYNIGRGHPVRLADALNHLISLSRVAVRVEVDPGLLRPADVPRQWADSTTFHQLTGWAPRISWDQTLEDTLNDWRVRVGVTLPVS